jgi:hypothetical protein
MPVVGSKLYMKYDLCTSLLIIVHRSESPFFVGQISQIWTWFLLPIEFVLNLRFFLETISIAVYGEFFLFYYLRFLLSFDRLLFESLFLRFALTELFSFN